MAKTHFVILLFSPLTARPPGPIDRREKERKEREGGREGNEADTDGRGGKS